MGAICQQSKIESLEIINSFNEGLQINMTTHQNDAPDKSYAVRVYGVPQLSEQVYKILASEMERQKINEQRLKGIELPAFVIHRKQIYYQGEWKEKLPHGKGKIYFSQGHYFEGYFNRGQAQCRNGILIFYDGSFYRGEFHNSQLSGIGRFVSTSGFIYEGNWENSKPQGFGKEIFQDGNQYQGQFVDGLKDGKGIFRWNDGKVYQGRFQKGKMNGKGKFYRGEQSFFEGQFRDNKKLGTGKLKTAYGSYQGQFKDGQFDGQGIFTWNDGKIYKGQFKSGQFHGLGILQFSNGKVIRGLWRQGQNIELHEMVEQTSLKKKKSK